jgi:hypothetical protein
MLTRSLVVSALAALLMAIPARAQADTLFTPYIGSAFAAKSGPTEPGSSFVYGADFMWVGTSGLGFEVDFAYHPKFFSADDDETLFDLDADGNVVTLMGNVVFGHKGGGIQPYVVGGAGLMRTGISSASNLFEDVSDAAFGIDLGGGIRVGGPKFGVRGDLRYFRQLQDVNFGDFDADLGSFSYWRGTVGLSIGF